MRAGVYVGCRGMTAPSIDAVPKRVRLDQVLVQRGLAPSRERAQALILAGAVRVDGARADRAAAPVAEASEVAVDEGPRFVSRGGEKLAGALDAFARAVAVLAVARDLAARGAPVLAVAPSPIAGREGNREIFVHARKGARGLEDAPLARAAAAAAE